MSDKIERYEEKKPETVNERPWVAPCVDIYENDNELLLTADVPGVNKENLKINFEKDELQIEGRVEEVIEATPLGREFRGVDYRRSFAVPAGIDAAKITAELKDGVLNLHLPKVETLKPRQIQIKAG